VEDQLPSCWRQNGVYLMSVARHPSTEADGSGRVKDSLSCSGNGCGLIYQSSAIKIDKRTDLMK
jgi:hypothetical protein